MQKIIIHGSSKLLNLKPKCITMTRILLSVYCAKYELNGFRINKLCKYWRSYSIKHKH